MIVEVIGTWKSWITYLPINHQMFCSGRRKTAKRFFHRFVWTFFRLQCKKKIAISTFVSHLLTSWVKPVIEMSLSQMNYNYRLIQDFYKVCGPLICLIWYFTRLGQSFCKHLHLCPFIIHSCNLHVSGIFLMLFWEKLIYRSSNEDVCAMLDSHSCHTISYSIP